MTSEFVFFRSAAEGEYVYAVFYQSCMACEFVFLRSVAEGVRVCVYVYAVYDVWFSLDRSQKDNYVCMQCFIGSSWRVIFFVFETSRRRYICVCMQCIINRRWSVNVLNICRRRRCVCMQSCIDCTWRVFCLRSVAAGACIHICICMYVCSVSMFVDGVRICVLDQSQKENSICMQCFDVCRWCVNFFRSAAIVYGVCICIFEIGCRRSEDMCICVCSVWRRIIICVCSVSLVLLYVTCFV